MEIYSQEAISQRDIRDIFTESAVTAKYKQGAREIFTGNTITAMCVRDIRREALS